MFVIYISLYLQSSFIRVAIFENNCRIISLKLYKWFKTNILLQNHVMMA